MPILSLDDGIIKQNNGVFLEGYGEIIRDGQYRLQTSQFKNLADFKFTSPGYELYWESDNVSGTGSTTIDTAVGHAVLTANDASVRYLQTEYNTHVIPPYSYRFWFGAALTAFTLGAARFGFWNGQRGVYLELSGTTGVNLVIQNTNTPLSIVIPRANWDDPLDGTGISGVTIDATLQQYYFMEYSWAGGYARFGALFDGIPRYAHTVYFGNNALYPDILIGNPNLPIRFEVEGVGSDQSLDVHFATIQADIGESSVAVNRVATRGHLANQDLLVDKTGNNADQYFSVMAIRLDPASLNLNYAVVVPTGISIMCTSGSNMHWKLVLIRSGAFLDDPSLTWNNMNDSAVQYAIAPNTLTYPAHTDTQLYADCIADGYFANNNDSDVSTLEDSLSRLYIRENGDSYELHLLVTTVNNAGAETVYGSIHFKELI